MHCPEQTFFILLWIRGEGLDPPNPSYKSLGANLSLYKKHPPAKILALQIAGARPRHDAKTRDKSAYKKLPQPRWFT